MGTILDEICYSKSVEFEHENSVGGEVGAEVGENGKEGGG